MFKPLVITITIGCSLVTTSLRSETFTTPELIARSASTECLDWCVIGVCFWLVCSPFPPKCSIRTTPKIAHRLPDLTVTAYDHPGETPWTEFRATLGELQSSGLDAISDVTVAGGGAPSAESLKESHLRFKEAQVIGNPAAVTANTFGVPFLCKSKVTPLLPYFSSEVNAMAWRSGIPDNLRPEALVPGLREIGQNALKTWGSVYPRSGFISQADETKAAAVIAQRAADVTTREGQIGHLYIPYGFDGHRVMTWGDPAARSLEECEASGGTWEDLSGSGPECQTRESVQWMPGSDEQSDQWQMVSPIQANQCESFGQPGEWSAGKESDDGAYAWNYWRPYECCIPGPGIFLTSIEIPPMCLN